MITLHRCSRDVGGVAALVLVLTVATVLSAQAHHVMGGRTPETFMQGLLSGLAHPVIGLDHLAFIVGMGVAAGVATLNLAIPVVFIVASALGVGLHVQGVALPAAELVVAASVLLIGAMVAAGRALPTGVGCAVCSGWPFPRLCLWGIDFRCGARAARSLPRRSRHRADCACR